MQLGKMCMKRCLLRMKAVAATPSITSSSSSFMSADGRLSQTLAPAPTPSKQLLSPYQPSATTREPEGRSNLVKTTRILRCCEGIGSREEQQAQMKRNLMARSGFYQQWRCYVLSSPPPHRHQNHIVRERRANAWK